MPANDRPKRQSVKSITKAEQAEIDAARNKAAEKARRAATTAAATRKRALKLTVDGISDRFSTMKIHDGGRRYRVTRRKDRRRRRTRQSRKA